jgi:hypothetical protein
VGQPSKSLLITFLNPKTRQVCWDQIRESTSESSTSCTNSKDLTLTWTRPLYWWAAYCGSKHLGQTAALANDSIAWVAVVSCKNGNSNTYSLKATVRIIKITFLRAPHSAFSEHCPEQAATCKLPGSTVLVWALLNHSREMQSLRWNSTRYCPVSTAAAQGLHRCTGHLPFHFATTWCSYCRGVFCVSENL